MLTILRKVLHELLCSPLIGRIISRACLHDAHVPNYVVDTDLLILLQSQSHVKFRCQHRAGAPVRPGRAGLIIGIECSRVRDSSWIYLTSLVTTRIDVELAIVQHLSQYKQQHKI